MSQTARSSRAVRLGAVALVLAAGLGRDPLERPSWREAAAYLRAARSADAAIAVLPAFDLLPFAYHFDPAAFRDPAARAERLASQGVFGVSAVRDVERLCSAGVARVALVRDGAPALRAGMRAELAAHGLSVGAERALPGVSVVWASCPPRQGGRDPSAE